MSWGLSLNRSHVLLWYRWGVSWAAFVGLTVLAGWNLRPRPDEVLFVLVLPLGLLIPYVLGCLIGATVKLWLVGRQTGTPLQRILIRERRG